MSLIFDQITQSRGYERRLSAADAADDGDEGALGHAPVDVAEDDGPVARPGAPRERRVVQRQLIGAGFVVADLREEFWS